MRKCKQKHIKEVLVAMLIAVTINTSCAQTIHTESADKFWQLITKLESDEPISDSMWLDFRSQFANNNWIERHNSGWNKNYESGIRKALEIVFRPSLQDVRDSIIALPEPDEFTPKSDDWNYVNMHTQDLSSLYLNKIDSIKEFYDRSIDGSYSEKMYNMALEMLPKKFEKPNQLDTINIYIFGISAAASAGSYGIMLPVGFLYERDKDQVGSLGAHELHHILRGSENHLSADIKDQDMYAVYAMHSALNEGSANLIGMNYTGFEDWKTRYTEDSEEIILSLDSLFSSTSRLEATREAINSLFKYSGGHNPGFYMADVINRNGLKEALRENVYNPFYFFLLYQQAASKHSSQPPLFSPKSIQYIKSLQQAYYKK